MYIVGARMVENRVDAAKAHIDRYVGNASTVEEIYDELFEKFGGYPAAYVVGSLDEDGQGLEIDLSVEDFQKAFER